ncbi:MAG: hypothetical protein ACM3NO_11380 [Deltaproteobacteria bacterium]
MTRRKLNIPYSIFSKYYDEIAAPLRAPNLRAREKVLLPRLRLKPPSVNGPGGRAPNPEPRLVCDLCCGEIITIRDSEPGFRD